MQPWNTPELCNVAGALAVQAERHPDATAVHYPTGVRGGNVRYASSSYRELDSLSDSYARGLRELGIGRGVRTVLMVPPGLDFIALFFALFKAGAVPVLIDPGIGTRHLKQCLAEAAPEAFIGVGRAQLARRLLGWGRGTVRHTVTIGTRPGWGGATTGTLLRLGERTSGSMLEATRPGEMAAILFTSGSTGIPKGVVYRHRHFAHQVGMLRDTFSIEPGECDLATFPPFALFDPALGMATVVPRMDPTRPARVRPEYLVQAIERFGVTSIFGSPALIRVLGAHAESRGLGFPGVRRVISAGAAVPIATIRRMQKALGENAAVYTPYGATECLPVANLSSAMIDADIEGRTRGGQGICVGTVIQPNRAAIIKITDTAVEHLDPSLLLPAGECGEIIVHGPTATDAYWRREDETRRAKLTDGEGRVWHRMGDIGYFDSQGRLWYCGRKSQRVESAAGTLFPDQVEAVFNAHADVERTALVGVGEGPAQTPVLVVELARGRGKKDRDRVREEVLRMASGQAALGAIRTVLYHPALPVDIRHNAKINREELAAWAARRLR